LIQSGQTSSLGKQVQVASIQTFWSWAMRTRRISLPPSGETKVICKAGRSAPAGGSGRDHIFGQLHEFLSARELAELHGCSKTSASEAIRELVEKGFVEILRSSGFNVKDKKRQASEYRLTLFPCDVKRQPASKAFMKWRPETH